MVRVLSNTDDLTPARPGERICDACGASPLGLFRSDDVATRRAAFAAWLCERNQWDTAVQAVVRAVRRAAARPGGVALRCFCPPDRYHAIGLAELVERVE